MTQGCPASRLLILSGRSALIILSLLAAARGDAQAAGFSLRFHGYGITAPDQDRVKIPINNPPRPADVGAGDFTLEFWMKAIPGENSAGTCSPGNDNWITGNIMFDRDVNGTGDYGDYGVSLFSTGIAFGVFSGLSGVGNGICGETNVADGVWHHIAVTRRAFDAALGTGVLRIFVDGMLDAEGFGPTGDVSYRDDRPPLSLNDPFLVIGAEKHDAGAQYPSYSGWIDEIRLSNTVRYTQNVTRPSQPFTTDINTVALYHLDEGSGDTITDSSGAAGGPSDGTRNFGGSPPGPEWSTGVPHFGAPVTIALTEIASGLSSPVAITQAGDGSGRLFITLQQGKVMIVNGTQVLPAPFLDLSPTGADLVLCCGERGLLSVAFHPNYPTTPYFYVYYTRKPDGAIVLARYSVSGNPNVANPNADLILLTIPHPVGNHNGGQLQFGPDGYLYAGVGDGGGAGDTSNNAQNLGTYLGKFLRFDVDGGLPYAIPADNPFVGQPSALGEIWALGLRNPWRFSFDRQRGDLFIADVGQGSREEVNFQPASSPGGENYQWRCMEGTIPFNGNPPCTRGVLTPPILDYDHSAGKCSVTGGYRYRGAQLPRLYGIYFYADFCTGQISGATPNGQGGWTTTQLFDAPFLISSFGEDRAGDLYVADYGNGKIYRITVAAPPNTPPFGSLDAPAAGATVSGSIPAGGWALDRETPSGSLTLALLIDGSPVSAPLARVARPDVCAVFPESTYPGACTSGVHFTWNTTGLSGAHTVAVRVTDAGGLSVTLGPRTVTVQAPSNPRMALETPGAGATVTQPVAVTGWAVDLGAGSGTGVDTLHLYAYPNPGSGTPPRFLGVATYGGARPDIGTLYGSRFTNSGYTLAVSGLSPGVYQVVVFAHSTVTGTFNNVQAVVVTVR